MWDFTNQKRVQLLGRGGWRLLQPAEDCSISQVVLFLNIPVKLNYAQIFSTLSFFFFVEILKLDSIWLWQRFMYTAGSPSAPSTCPWRRSSLGSSGMFAIHTKESSWRVARVSAQTCCGPPAARLTESSVSLNRRQPPGAGMSAAQNLGCVVGFQQVALIRQKVMCSKIFVASEDKMRRVGRNLCGDLKKKPGGKSEEDHMLPL